MTVKQVEATKVTEAFKSQCKKHLTFADVIPGIIRRITKRKAAKIDRQTINLLLYNNEPMETEVHELSSD